MKIIWSKRLALNSMLIDRAQSDQWVCVCVRWSPGIRGSGADGRGGASSGGSSETGGCGGGGLSDFIEGLGPGQLVGRQVLGAPALGDIQLSMCYQKGFLEVYIHIVVIFYCVMEFIRSVFSSLLRIIIFFW